MVIEIVDFPMENGGSFQFVMCLPEGMAYQNGGRGTPKFMPRVTGCDGSAAMCGTPLFSKRLPGGS